MLNLSLVLCRYEIAGIPTAGFRSKSWDEFAKPNAPRIDFIFTVCDNVAHEIWPIWPGQPMTAHWVFLTPQQSRGTPQEIERAFHEAFLILDRRIALFLSLPFTTLESPAIQKEINQIGGK